TSTTRGEARPSASLLPEVTPLAPLGVKPSSPPPEDFPPGGTDGKPYHGIQGRQEKPVAPPGARRRIAGPVVDGRGRRAVVRERGGQARHVTHREHREIRRRAGRQDDDQDRRVERRHARGDRRKRVV